MGSGAILSGRMSTVVSSFANTDGQDQCAGYGYEQAWISMLVQSNRIEGTPPGFSIAASEDGGNNLRPAFLETVDVCSSVHLCLYVLCCSMISNACIGNAPTMELPTYYGRVCSRGSTVVAKRATSSTLLLIGI